MPGPEPAPDLAAFAAPPHDAAEDLVGDPIAADLRALFAGNQFMALPEVFERFRASVDPQPAVFYETLPPGIVMRQFRQGGLRMGSLILRFTPDVVAASPSALGRLHDDGLTGPPRRYASNGLALLVRQGNPARIEGWHDLARQGVRVAFPNPETEGIGRLALEAITAAGGEQLREAVFVRNRERGFVRLTAIHHRESPAWLHDGTIDVAIVWQTEALHHLRAGRPVQEISLPPGHNKTGEYAAATVAGAPHPELAAAFVDYLTGPDGGGVFQRYGFAPAAGQG